MPKSKTIKRYGIKDSPFYRLRSRRKLADLLNVSVTVLNSIASNENLYKRVWKHKTEKDVWIEQKPSATETESYRPIDIPDPRLKAIQAQISCFLARIAPPEYLYSPVKGRSYVDNAANHIGSEAFWLLDVANYFPSCSANKIARFFKVRLECSPDVTAILVKLTTLENGLPQGSSCSPVLAFLSNWEMWDEVAQLAKSANCKFSLYADDLTISGKIVPKKTIWEIKKVIHRHGLTLKSGKEVSLLGKPADVTGVIIKQNCTSLPNRQLKRLAQLRIERRNAVDPQEQKKLDNQIAGRNAQRRQVERYLPHSINSSE
ncbi:MAG: reverse transcriptase family protein [Alphaproteobacteria bacterium]